MDWVNTLIGVAQQNVDLDQFDQGAGKIEEVRGIVDELSQVRNNSWETEEVSRFNTFIGAIFYSTHCRIVCRNKVCCYCCIREAISRKEI